MMVSDHRSVYRNLFAQVRACDRRKMLYLDCGGTTYTTQFLRSALKKIDFRRAGGAKKLNAIKAYT